MSNAITFYFKEAMPNFSAFKVFLSEIPYSYNLADELIVQKAYNLLYRRYALDNIRYASLEAFYFEFANVVENQLDRFIKRIKLITEAYKITSEDILQLGKQVQNFATNPNDEISDPLSPLSYITNQTFMATIGNKLEAYLRAIDNLPSEYDEEFLSEFKYLFMEIIPQTIPYYTKGE